MRSRPAPTHVAHTPAAWSFNRQRRLQERDDAGRGARPHPALTPRQRPRIAEQPERSTGSDRFAVDVIDGTTGTPFGGSIARLSIHDNVFVGGRALSIDTTLPDVGDHRPRRVLQPARLDRAGTVADCVRRHAQHGQPDGPPRLDRAGDGRPLGRSILRRSGRPRLSTPCRQRRGRQGCFPSPTTAPGPTVPRFDHIFVVVDENHSYEQIIGSPDAPYLDFLAGEGTSATDFHGLTHPSLPNYLGLIGGDTFGVATDCSPTDPGCSVAAPSLPDRIEDAGLTWRGYFDGMGSPCVTSSSGSYRINHNPFIYFDPIRTSTARCAAAVRPFGDLSTDLASRSTTRNLSFIVPDNCHDMHDCPVKAGDDWLRGVLPSSSTRRPGPPATPCSCSHSTRMTGRTATGSTPRSSGPASPARPADDERRPVRPVADVRGCLVASDPHGQ